MTRQMRRFSILFVLGCLLLSGCNAKFIGDITNQPDLFDDGDKTPNVLAQGTEDQALHRMLTGSIPGAVSVALPKSAGTAAEITGEWVSEDSFAFVATTPDMSCGAYIWNSGDGAVGGLEVPRRKADKAQAVRTEVRGLEDKRVFIALGEKAYLADWDTGRVLDTVTLPLAAPGADTLDISPDGLRLAFVSEKEKRVTVTSFHGENAVTALKSLSLSNNQTLTPSSVRWVDNKNLLYTLTSQGRIGEVGLLNVDEGSRKVFADWMFSLTPLLGGRFFFSSGADGFTPLAVGLYDPVLQKAESFLSGGEVSPTQGWASKSGNVIALCFWRENTVGLSVLRTKDKTELSRWEGLADAGKSSGAAGIPLLCRALPSCDGGGVMLVTHKLSDGGARLYYVSLDKPG